MASDICSLAVMFAEMLTGLPPFSDLQNDVAVTFAMARGERPHLPSSNGDVALSMITELIKRMWTEEPSTRPEASEVMHKLTEANVTRAEKVKLDEAILKLDEQKRQADEQKRQAEQLRQQLRHSEHKLAQAQNTKPGHESKEHRLALRVMQRWITAMNKASVQKAFRLWLELGTEPTAQLKISSEFSSEPISALEPLKVNGTTNRIKILKADQQVIDWPG